MTADDSVCAFATPRPRNVSGWCCPGWLNRTLRCCGWCALKPGGCLVAEELGFQSFAVDPRLDARTRSVFGSVAEEAHLAILSAQHGFDPVYGRRIAGDLSPV